MTQSIRAIYAVLPPGLPVHPRSELTARFVTALAKEARMRCAGCVPGVLYLGGEDPLAFPVSVLTGLLTMLKESAHGRVVTEWTVAGSWRSAGREKLSACVDKGVNRICITVPLAEAGLAVSTLRRAGKAGMTHIAVDLFFAPRETDSVIFRDALCDIVSAGATHISVYAGGEPDADRERALHEQADAILQDAGYARYELWSYARPGHQCAYTALCWRCESYLGLGPGAASHIAPCRWTNEKEVAGYISALEAGRLPPREEEQLTPGNMMGEMLAFGLQLTEGVAPMRVLERVRRVFPNIGKTPESFSNVWKKREAIFQALENQGLIERAGERFILAEHARYEADSVLLNFLE